MYISTVNKLSENATCPPVASDQVPVGPGGVPAIPGIHATGLYPTLKSGQHNETSRQKSVSSFTAASGTDTKILRYSACSVQWWEQLLASGDLLSDVGLLLPMFIKT